jgi:hypothetical protein
LAEVMEAIERGFSSKAAQMQRQATPAHPQPQSPQAPAQQAQRRAPMFNPAPHKFLTLDLEYEPSREMEINTLLRNLQSLCINLTRVAGQSRDAA